MLTEEEASPDNFVEDSHNGAPRQSSAEMTRAVPVGGGEDYGSCNSFDITEDQGTAENTCDSVYTEFEQTNEDRSELQKQLYVATKKAVSAGEQNISLALELEKYKDELSTLKNETEQFRAVLLRGINGGVSDSSNYSHVSLDELLRLRIQESSPLPPTSSTSDEALGLSRNESSVGVIQRLEHKLGLEAQQNQSLEAKCLALKGELEAASKHVDDVEKLRLKVSHMVQRLRTEREGKYKLQKELSTEKSKVEALSDHLQKLMVHLKHEAITKARAQADHTHLQRELETMKTRNGALVRKNERKDQVIGELRESG